MSVKVKTVQEIFAVGIEGNGRIPDFNKDVDKLYSYIYSKGFQQKISGPLIGLFYSEFGGKYIAAIPVIERFRVEDGINFITLPKIKCAYVIHKGSYKTIESSFNELKRYFKKKNLKWPNFPVREIYLVGPGSSNEKDYLTEIQVPLPKNKNK